MDRKKHQAPHKPSQPRLQAPKPLPDYTKDCHRTIRQYICTHRRLVATPTHVFPCIFYQHRSIDIHCARIKEPPELVEIGELCDRCAPPQTVRLSSSSFRKRKLQVKNSKNTGKSQENSDTEEERNRDETIASFSRGIDADLKVGREKRKAERIAVTERASIITNKEIKVQEKRQEDVENLTVLLGKSHIFAKAAEKQNLGNEKAKEHETLQLQISESRVSTNERITTPQEIETKDLKGKARGWVNVNPESTPVIPSVGNGEPFARPSLLQRFFRKREAAQKETNKTWEEGRMEAVVDRKVQKDGSWAQVNDDPTWDGHDEEWEDVERVSVGVNDNVEGKKF